jgi:hypothetical protein
MHFTARLSCLAVVLATGLGVLTPLSAHALAPTTPSKTGMLRGHEGQVQRNRFGIGLTGGVDGSTGFAYRQYFGNSALQVNLLPIVADRGNYVAVFLGAQYIDYMLVWAQGSRSRALAPSTTALRLVANTSVHLSSDDSSMNIDCGTDPTPECKALQQVGTETTAYTSAGVGFGFEFGAVQRPGFSVALDLVMTARWENTRFYAAYPLPHATMMYSW